MDLHGRYVVHALYRAQRSDSLSKAEVYARGRYLKQELVQRGPAKIVTK